MANNAAACVERATSDMLIGPDWAINIELCDIINMDPGQAKDALKLLKKRLTSKSPKTQLLALFVLETLSKNCGEHVFQQIVERDILHEMVKIVKKKPDLSVREKILILIDTWQEALGGSRGRFPQYYGAFNELRATGVEFPPREENTVPIFTPPQTQPISHPPPAAYPHSSYEEAAVQASLQTDIAGMSLSEIQNAEGLADVLMEMLSALNPMNHQDLKQEVIVDLVEQCQSDQKRVMNLVNNTTDEELLVKGLALNDNLQRVLTKYEHMTKGIPVSEPTQQIPVPLLMTVNHDDDETEDDFTQLSHRSSSRDNGLGKKPANGTGVSSLLPPPPSSKNSSVDPQKTVDFLSGDSYISGKTVGSSNSTTTPPTSSRPLTSPVPNLSPPPPPDTDDFINPTASMFTGKPAYEEPALPPAPWDVPSTATAIPPPPSKYNQRQQFFEQQQGFSSGSGSYDGLVEQTQKMNLKPSITTKQEKPEDALFKDLVDFAKAKSSSPSKGNRSY
ncbi:TOM1-like protein 4 [Impatiens glandulifera]|uniref:TOM1-like protein 4 n=1 Tax=Impatiens glandulifera TaxID=253017 RepID=UPI001FB12493|nr:TOM1-like protein 4 [Impatiens glandulifera]